MRSKSRLCLWLGSAAALVALAPAARADDAPLEGFGKRSSLALTLENLFGIASAKFDYPDAPTDPNGGLRSSGYSFDTKGMFPLYGGGGLGVWGIERSGLTYGSALWATHASSSASSGSVTIFLVRPRIGYGGSTPNPRIGYWVRTGPTFLHGGGDGSSANALAWSAEAFGVVSIVPHFSLLVGPGLDFAVWGKEARDGADTQTFHYSGYGFTAAFMAEL